MRVAGPPPVGRNTGEAIGVPPSRKVTVPPGGGTPGAGEPVELIPEVNVTVCPAKEGLGEELKPMAVVLRLTTCVTVLDELGA
jgi:hypothetical protein